MFHALASVDTLSRNLSLLAPPQRSSVKNEQLQLIAERQLRDFDARNPGTIFGDPIDLTLADAYEIQRRFVQLRVARGEQVAGYKVGCTSATIRQQLKIEHPVFGHLFAEQSWTSGVELPSNRFCKPAIEGELAVVLGDVVGTTKDWVEQIAAVFPVVELHNMMFRRGQSSAVELVANNAIHAGYVYPKEQPHSLHLGSSRLDIVINDEEPIVVEGEQLATTIVNSLEFLSQELASRGSRLKPGQVILCGSIADLFPISGHTRVEVSSDRYGSVEYTMTDG